MFDEVAVSNVPAKSYWVGQASVRVVQVAPALVVAYSSPGRSSDVGLSE